MGTPMMGEQLEQGMVGKQQTRCCYGDSGQGNNVYAMLRARLPQEYLMSCKTYCI